MKTTEAKKGKEKASFITEIEKSSLGEIVGLDKDFEWKNIKNFSVITGKNGSGKTRLIDALYKKYRNDYIARYVDVNYRLVEETKENQIQDIFNFVEEDGQYYFYDNDEKRRASPDRIFSRFGGNGYDWFVLRDIYKKRQKIELPQGSEIRKSEFDREEEFKKNGDVSCLIPSEKNLQQPWDKIDKILTDGDNGFGLKIRLNRHAIRNEVKIFRKPKKNDENPINETQIEVKDLSSGEQVAFALSLWTWASADGKKTQLLLIDEFDAHLNPCLMKSFINSINEYFINEDVQVIMTTHSPVTVNYASKFAEIIWMEDGKIDNSMTEDKIIEELSSGLISLQNFEGDFQSLIQNRHKSVLYLEGKIDKTHLENSIKVFDKRRDFEEIFIFPCAGVDSISWFMQAVTGQKKSKRIALLDSDNAGKEAAEVINSKGYKSIFISEENGLEIEDLFDKELLEDELRNLLNKKKISPLEEAEKKELKDLKSSFAKKMSEEKNLTKENFKNFEPLLTKILEAFAPTTNS